MRGPQNGGPGNFDKPTPEALHTKRPKSEQRGPSHSPLLPGQSGSWREGRMSPQVASARPGLFSTLSPAPRHPSLLHPAPCTPPLPTPQGRGEGAASTPNAGVSQGSTAGRACRSLSTAQQQGSVPDPGQRSKAPNGRGPCCPVVTAIGTELPLCSVSSPSSCPGFPPLDPTIATAPRLEAEGRAGPTAPERGTRTPPSEGSPGPTAALRLGTGG